MIVNQIIYEQKSHIQLKHVLYFKDFNISYIIKNIKFENCSKFEEAYALLSFFSSLENIGVEDALNC